MRRIPFLALALALMLASTMGSPAWARSVVDQKLYDCKLDYNPAYHAICSSPQLRAAVSEIDRHYADLRRSRDPDVRYLAAWDRFNLHGNIWSCVNQVGHPAHPDPADCGRATVTDKKAVFQHPITKAVLINQIQQNDSFNAGLVERFPDSFLGRVGDFFGELDSHQTGPTTLAGRYKDEETHKFYPMEIDQATAAALNFFQARPEVGSFWRGRFERRNGRLTFIVNGGDLLFGD